MIVANARRVLAKRSWVIVLSLTLMGAQLRAQSVAETLRSLSGRVEVLEKETGSAPLPPSLKDIKHALFSDGYVWFSNSSDQTIAFIGKTPNSGGGIALNDPTGKQIVFLGADNGGRGVLEINGERKFNYAEGQLKDMKNVSFNDGSVVFENHDGKQIAYLGTTETSGGGLALFDSAGKRAVLLTTDSNGQGVLELNGERKFNYAEDQLKDMKNVSFNDGFVIFKNHDGKQVAYIGTDSGGQGALLINGDRKYDYAEVFDISNRLGLTPGSVAAIAADGTGMELASGPYNRRVIGVIAGAGGLSSGIRTGTRSDGTTDLSVAVAGQVYVRVCDENGSVEVGDLLVSSSRPGVAMRASDSVPGTIIGKAMQQYKSLARAEEGLVRMLVMNH
jgi:hypothetical protein